MEELKVTRFLQEPKTAKDGREYAVIGVKEPITGGLINTTKPRAKVIWSHEPMAGPDHEGPEKPNDYYEPIVKALEAGKHPNITGSIKTVDTEPYFIPSKNGEYSHPDTGVPANRATQKTYVVFPDENVDTLLRNDDLLRKGQEQGQALKEPSEELVEEDLGAEAPVA